MEDELQCKHREKKTLKKDIKAVSIRLKSCLDVLINSVLLFQSMTAPVYCCPATVNKLPSQH